MREMNCGRAAGFLPLYAAGDLDEARAGEVASHVAACEGCRRLAEDFRESRALLAEACAAPEFGAEFYAGVRSSVLARISRDREPSTPSFIAALFGRRLAYAAAFAVALFALALAFQHSRGGGTRETTRELARAATRAIATPERDRRDDAVVPPQPDGAKGGTAPRRVEAAAAPQTEATRREATRREATRREVTRRDAPARRPELTPQTLVRGNEFASVAWTPPVGGGGAAGESASPAAGTDPAAAASNAAARVSRIEIQTADPNIRIIWLTPRESEAPRTDEPKNENGERK